MAAEKCPGRRSCGNRAPSLSAAAPLSDIDPVVIASTRGPNPLGHAPSACAKPTISSANPCQLVLPAAVKWKVPHSVPPRSICPAIAISAAAISAAAVGQPRWSATTLKTGRSAPSRNMVFTKFAPCAPYTQAVRRMMWRGAAARTARSPASLLRP